MAPASCCAAAVTTPWPCGCCVAISPPPVEEAPAFKAHNLLGEVFEKQGNGAAAAGEYRTALAMARTYRPAQEG